MTLRDQGWLTQEETAELTGYSLNTLRCMRSLGTGPKYYKGGKIRYKIVDVEAFMEAKANGGAK